MNSEKLAFLSHAPSLAFVEPKEAVPHAPPTSGRRARFITWLQGASFRKMSTRPETFLELPGLSGLRPIA